MEENQGTRAQASKLTLLNFELTIRHTQPGSKIQNPKSPLPFSPPPSPQPHCTGCGSKVGSDALSLAMEKIRQEFPDFGQGTEDLLIGLEAPDDAAVMQVPAGQVMVHTVDFFTGHGG
jgi:selenide,water dikinase